MDSPRKPKCTVLANLLVSIIGVSQFVSYLQLVVLQFVTYLHLEFIQEAFY